MFDAFWGLLQAQLENSIFAGGLALGAMGVLAAYGRRLPKVLRHVALTYFSTSITIDSRSALFSQVVAWLGEHRYTGRARRLTAAMVSGADHDDRRLTLSPALGVHFFREKGVPLWLTRRLEDDGVASRNGMTSPRESITIRALTRRRSFVQDLLIEIHLRYGRTDPDEIRLYIADSYDDWVERGRLRKRLLPSLFLEDGLAETLLSDARGFLEAEHWYAQRGIPWRRGFLLHGPAGTGKTSLVKALASELNLNLCLVNLASERVTDDSLAELLACAPPRSLLLFEDIDALFAGRTQLAAAPKLTFSGLLNAIDGVAAQEGRLLVMTTNHPEQLDPALIRPGRVDRQVEIGLADGRRAARMVLTFFPEHPAVAEAVSARMGNQRLAPAALQGCLLACRENPLMLTAEIAHLLPAAGPPVALRVESQGRS